MSNLQSKAVGAGDPGGLTSAEVAERRAAGLGNEVPDAPSRTVAQILRANILTRFNLLMMALLAVVLVCRAWRDALFGGVIIANAIVGIVQELRAKATLDQLALLSAPRVVVIRDGEAHDVGVSDLVLDDVIELRAGFQIAADAEVLLTEGLEVDESLLTGESDPVLKHPGDELFSGSFVVSGSGRARVAKVGADAYAAKLAEEARRFTLARSELRVAIDKIVTWISWAIIPVGTALFITQYRENPDIREALVKATGGVVAMVPEGLILLLSVAFAVGVVRLAAKRTLVQELPAIETLARVDVVCLDKTGTITSGQMDVAEIVHLPADTADTAGTAETEAALSAIAHLEPDPNPTQAAIGRHLPDPPGWKVDATVPFSSARKWSAAAFEGHGWWVVGAPEMVLLGNDYEPIAQQVQAAAELGRRVLLAASTPSTVTDAGLPDDLTPRALVLIEDQVRPDAPETLAFFEDQGVILKVISGDNPVTVGAVATRAGLPDADNLLDARNLPDDETDPEGLANAVEATTVFGRVGPHQKRAMVKALQSRGHVVAMTGDGVNDVLALKDADVGIAMASGSEATRAVAQLVLLDSTFSGLPGVVQEGRKVINNLQRVASLFLTKTAWAMVLAIATSVLVVPYPFLPRHITIVSTGIIGIPSFLLALAPNTERVRGNFFGEVARVALPAGVLTSIAVMTGYLIARAEDHLSATQHQSTATIILIGMSVIVLIRTARPWALWKVAMCLVIGGAVSLALVVPWLREFFALDLPGRDMVVVAFGLIAAGGWAIAGTDFVWERVLRSRAARRRDA